MIPAERWRPPAVGIVVGAALLVVLVGAAVRPVSVLFAVPALLVSLWWALRRPGGWGALALLVVEVLLLAAFLDAPGSVTDWAVAALCGVALLGTHLALALLAAWPPRAALPAATARRWLLQGAVLAAAGGVAAFLGVLGSVTPVAWGPWVGAGALLAVGLVAVQVGLVARRRR